MVWRPHYEFFEVHSYSLHQKALKLTFKLEYFRIIRTHEAGKIKG
jgi:hypothetical protein